MIYCERMLRSRVDLYFFFFFSSRRRHTRLQGDWSSDVCSSDLLIPTYRLPKPIANPFAIDAPIISELARPGPLVAANASISDNRVFAALAADRKSVV